MDSYDLFLKVKEWILKIKKSPCLIIYIIAKENAKDRKIEELEIEEKEIEAEVKLDKAKNESEKEKLLNETINQLKDDIKYFETSLMNENYRDIGEFYRKFKKTSYFNQFDNFIKYFFYDLDGYFPGNSADYSYDDRLEETGTFFELADYLAKNSFITKKLESQYQMPQSMKTEKLERLVKYHEDMVALLNKKKELDALLK